MIAELVKQYDTLKRCGVSLPDPYFKKLEVSLEIILKSDSAFHVDWLEKASDSNKGKASGLLDNDCPVTERSDGRASSNDTPHGLVDNPTWILGILVDGASGEKRRLAYRSQLIAFSEFCNNSQGVQAQEIQTIIDVLNDKKKLSMIGETIENILHNKIIVKVQDEKKREEKWLAVASKKNIRWVVESLVAGGRPVHALEPVKKAWQAFQKSKQKWWGASSLDGDIKPLRLMHPKFRGGSLISFNEPTTYCRQFHESFRLKTDLKSEKKESDDNKEGSTLPAQIGFEEAEKYVRALEWLIENSSVRFGEKANCVWIDQSGSADSSLDRSAHDLVTPQGKKTYFKRGKARPDKGEVLEDTTDLIQSLKRFRNGQTGQYRNKRFYMLSLLLRNKGRHAVLGGYVGLLGDLEDNAEKYVQCSSINIPVGYFAKNDAAQEFCPTLMDVLDEAGVKSEKKARLIWDQEVMEVVVFGRPLPTNLCRIVVSNAIRHKHLEQSKKNCEEYKLTLAIAAACARHRLIASQRKEHYGMGLDTNIKEPGYLAGRLFAICERIQKAGRDWGVTMSDKLFAGAMDRPRDTLAQLYKNCLCYDIYKDSNNWFTEIFDKISLRESDEKKSVMPVRRVDMFEFLLGYWHQRAKLQEDSMKKKEDQKQMEVQEQKEETP